MIDRIDVEPDATQAALDRSLDMLDVESCVNDGGHLEVIGQSMCDLVRDMLPSEPPHEPDMARVDRALAQLRAELFEQRETIARLSYWSV